MKQRLQEYLQIKNFMTVFLLHSQTKNNVFVYECLNVFEYLYL